MKTIKVVAAIIHKEGKIFATQRGYGEFKDWWEFPGGKIEKGETSEEAIIREIREELETDVKVEEYLNTVEYDYPQFHLVMECFICGIERGELNLKEHEAAKWLSYEEVDAVKWLPADIHVVNSIKSIKSIWHL